MATTTAVGKHPDVEAVAVRMEAGRLVVQLEGADHLPVLLGDDPLLEETGVVPLLVVVARLFDRPRVVRIAEVAAGHPGWVVVARERAQARGG